MALTIKNLEVEALATELASWTGESKTETIRRALLERRTRVRLTHGKSPKLSLVEFLETKVWPSLPGKMLGKPVTKSEREALLGYGPEGV